MTRIDALLQAQAQAVALFDEIEVRGLIAPGRLESQINAEIHALAARRFGVDAHWHKRIVRAGRNTLCPYDDNPPDLEVQADDVVFIDLGPVFEDWEADFGRTYVMGDDPIKHRIVADGEACWRSARDHYVATPDITAAEYFEHLGQLAEERGWELGQWHTGHLIGEFPHERPTEKIHNFIMPGNDRPMRGKDSQGRDLVWILEVHFVDKARSIGSFCERLLL